MAQPVQSSSESEYGAKVEQERNEEALAATQPAPSVPLPPVQGGAAPEGEGSITVKNPYMLLPAGANFPQRQQRMKTPVEEDYDVGMLFQVLGSQNPVMRRIAEELMGK